VSIRFLEVLVQGESIIADEKVWDVLVVVWKWIRIRETNGAILDSLSNL
jgi:hypothetical protein